MFLTTAGWLLIGAMTAALAGALMFTRVGNYGTLPFFVGTVALVVGLSIADELNDSALSRAMGMLAAVGAAAIVWNLTDVVFLPGAPSFSAEASFRDPHSGGMSLVDGRLTVTILGRTLRNLQGTYCFDPADTEANPYSLGNGTWGPVTVTPGDTRNVAFIHGTEEQLRGGFFMVTWWAHRRPPETAGVTLYVRDSVVDEAADQSAASI